MFYTRVSKWSLKALQPRLLLSCGPMAFSFPSVRPEMTRCTYGTAHAHITWFIYKGACAHSVFSINTPWRLWETEFCCANKARWRVLLTRQQNNAPLCIVLVAENNAQLTTVHANCTIDNCHTNVRQLHICNCANVPDCKIVHNFRIVQIAKFVQNCNCNLQENCKIANLQFWKILRNNAPLHCFATVRNGAAKQTPFVCFGARFRTKQCNKTMHRRHLGNSRSK